MNKVNYRNLLFVPSYVANAIEGSGYRKDVRNRVCSFLRNLMRDSKRQNDDSNIFNYIPRSRNYLRKVLGGNYNNHLLPLLEQGIIEQTSYKSGNISKDPKCREYRISKWNQPEKLEGELGLIKVGEEGKILELEEVIDKVLTVICDTLFEDALKTLGLVALEYEEIVEEQGVNKYFGPYVSRLENSDLNIEKLFQTSVYNIQNVSIKDYQTGTDITEEAFPVFLDGKKEVKYFTLKGALSLAKKESKTLIKDKRKYFITNPDKFIRVKKSEKLMSDLSTIKSLKDKVYRANRNTTNNRLDTNLTNMSGYLLERIMLDNDLINIDLCNSQLAISTLIIDLDTEDFEKYKELSLNCKLYEYLKEQLNLKSDIFAKTTCFEVMFSSHKNRSSRLKKFKELFPTVMAWINNYKELNGYEQFSISLQKKEAEIFIDNLYELVNKDYFVFTVHDSLIVKRADEERVREIIKQYFQEIGFEVMLR